jgi:hypothetical protein
LHLRPGIACRDADCYTRCVDPMKCSRHVPRAPGRMLSAVVCLVAVVLLWAPLWAAAWSGMTCCTGRMCPIHGHSAPNHPRPVRAEPEKTPMDCEHHSGNAIANCSMSCSHDSGPFLTTAVIFVLPAPVAISQPAPAMAAPLNFSPAEFGQSFEPLSPPPRIALFSL